jgi:hypothetical protein
MTGVYHRTSRNEAGERQQHEHQDERERNKLEHGKRAGAAPHGGRRGLEAGLGGGGSASIADDRFIRDLCLAIATDHLNPPEQFKRARCEVSRRAGLAL